VGLLLLAVSASFKGFVRVMDQAQEPGEGASRARVSARLGQYLGLVTGATVIAWPATGTLGAVILLALVFFTYLVLVLAARYLAATSPQLLLRVVRPVFSAWNFLASPLVAASSRAVAWVEARTPAKAPDVEGSFERWSDRVGLENDTVQLLRNALYFRDRTVSDVMVPRPDVTWLSVDDDPHALVEKVRRSGYSRFPLCNGAPDAVIGYVHLRDLGVPGGRAIEPGALAKAARPVTFVPETGSVMGLLHRFQENQGHMAVVVDEFGGMAGIVTLEDLLEALVGEIRDEFDEFEEPEITLLGSGEIIADGSVKLDELERLYGFDFGDVEEETIGGLVFGQLAREATRGDEVRLDGLALRVEDVDGLRVTRVRLTRQPVSQEEPALEMVT